MMISRDLTQLALLSALIAAAGALKIPSPFPFGEFQLSAPLAVAVCVVFGPKKYLLSGILASAAGMMLGTHTLWNLFIALQFRLVVCFVLYIFHNHPAAILMAGPAGTMTARLTLLLFIEKADFALITAAIPGMIFTAAVSPFFVRTLRRAVSVGNPVRADDD